MTQKLIFPPVFDKNSSDKIPRMDEKEAVNEPQIFMFLERYNLIKNNFEKIISEISDNFSNFIIFEKINFISQKLRIYQKEIIKNSSRYISLKIFSPKMNLICENDSFVENFGDDILSTLFSANKVLKGDYLDFFAKSFLYFLDLIFSYFLISSEKLPNFTKIKNLILRIFVSKNENAESEGINEITAESIMSLSNSIISLYEMSIDELMSVSFNDLELESAMSIIYFTHRTNSATQRLLVLSSRAKTDEHAAAELNKLSEYVNK